LKRLTGDLLHRFDRRRAVLSLNAEADQHLTDGLGRPLM